MFDIGFAELLVIGIAALLVIGPERLPTVVRAGSLLLGRLRRSVQSLRTELEREMGVDEVRRELHDEEMLHDARRAEQELHQLQEELNFPEARRQRIDPPVEDDSTVS